MNPFLTQNMQYFLYVSHFTNAAGVRSIEDIKRNIFLSSPFNYFLLFISIYFYFIYFFGCFYKIKHISLLRVQIGSKKHRQQQKKSRRKKQQQKKRNIQTHDFSDCCLLLISFSSSSVHFLPLSAPFLFHLQSSFCLFSKQCRQLFLSCCCFFLLL